jgi:DNA-binding NarL/FixJ family response regulator
MSIRVLIADDCDAMRENLKCLVREHTDIEVIGEAADGETAVALAKGLSPDVVLMDINMPKLNGIEAAAHILRDNAATRVTVLSAHSNRSFVTAGLKAGISGYVLKTSILDDVVPALRAAMANELFLSSEVAALVPGKRARHPSKADRSVAATHE